MSPALLALAASINDSDALMKVYAAPEWDELSDDGKQWVAGLVRETLNVAAAVASAELDHIFRTTTNGHGANTAKRILAEIERLAA